MNMAGIYLATVWEKDKLKKEGIIRILPRKRSTRGRKATISSKVLSGPIPHENLQPDTMFSKKLDEDIFLEEENANLKWEPYRYEYTEGEKKLLIAK